MNRVFSASPWEKQVGFCRAIRVGDQIRVAGTAPVDAKGALFAPNNAYEQTHRCFQIIAEALGKFEAQLSDVYRTRIYVCDISVWEEYGRAHKELFTNHPPVATMVEVSALIAPGMMVEIEVDAYLPNN